jgi:hypothetical protein
MRISYIIRTISTTHKIPSVAKWPKYQHGPLRSKASYLAIKASSNADLTLITVFEISQNETLKYKEEFARINTGLTFGNLRAFGSPQRVEVAGDGGSDKRRAPNANSSASVC